MREAPPAMTIPRTRARLGNRLALVLMVSAATLGALASSVPLAAAESAMPEDAETLVLIRPLEGPEAQDLQLTVEAAVAENFSAVSASKDEEAQLKKGSAELVRMSREKKYRAYVSGVIKSGARGRLLVLVVHSGKDGEPVGEAKFPGPSNKAIEAKVDKQAGPVLAKLLRKTAVAEGGDAEEDDGKETVELKVTLEEEPEAPSDEADAPAVAKSPLDVNLAVGFLNLSLTYNEPVTDRFGFQLLERPTTPLTVRAGGHLYPGAWFTDGVAADVGLALRYYRGIGGSIEVLGTPYDLDLSELQVGLRLRIPIGETELGLGVGWGQTAAVMAGDNLPFSNNPALDDPGLFPDTVYTFLRAGVDLRQPLTDELSLTAGFGVRLPDVGDEAGELGERSWFPRASASGMDAELGAMYELIPNLSITAGADLRVYGLKMHSQAGDVGISSVAGGASDRYLGAFAGIDYRL